MMKKFFSALFCTAAFLSAPAVFAQNAQESAPTAPAAIESDAALAPDVALKSMIDHILADLKNNPEYRSSPEKLKAFVESQISPHINFRRMTALAVGREWRKATEEEKQKLTGLFSDLLIRTYSNALSSYGADAQKIIYKPLKMQDGDTEATVKMQLQQPGAKPIDFDTRMEKTDAGWRIFDVVVAGISLVTNYRDQFNQTLRQGGFPALIDLLENQSQTLIDKKNAKN